MDQEAVAVENASHPQVPSIVGNDETTTSGVADNAPPLPSEVPAQSGTTSAGAPAPAEPLSATEQAAPAAEDEKAPRKKKIVKVVKKKKQLPTDTTATDLPAVQSSAQEAPQSDVKKTFRTVPGPLREPVYNTHSRLLPSTIKADALKVHPKGFKVLSKGSPIERAFTSYFRLPPRPSKHFIAEQHKLRQTIQLSIPELGRRKDGVVLDGFMLIDAASVQDPEEAREAVINDSNVVGAVADDLAFFVNLEYLDLGENNVNMAQLAPLQNLVELHLHCNLLHDLDIPEGSFLRLQTLNASFNQLTAHALEKVAQLPALARLDLSCNSLRQLPASLEGLVNIRQLALENNKLSTSDVFLSLSTMPNLAEVNLNFNNLSSIPMIPEGGFNNLEVLGLASNQIVYFEDVFALTTMPALRRVVLWGNPIERRRKDSEILLYELSNLDVAVVTEGPVPPKRKVADFYAANTSKFVKIKEFRHVVKDKKPVEQPQQSPQGQSDAFSSFFVTQPAPGPQGQAAGQADPLPTVVTDAERARSQPQPAQAATAQRQSGSGGQQGTALDSWFGRWDDPPEEEGSAPPSRPGRSQDVTVLRERDSAGVGTDMNMTLQSDDFILDDSSVVTRPNANIRSVMTELKRVLRNPIPGNGAPKLGRHTTQKH